MERETDREEEIQRGRDTVRKKEMQRERKRYREEEKDTNKQKYQRERERERECNKKDRMTIRNIFYGNKYNSFSA